jgi:hypothetical protein
LEGHVQISVAEASPGQLRAWTELWSKLLAPAETKHSTMVAEAATAPEESGGASARKAEQAIVEASERSTVESAHV